MFCYMGDLSYGRVKKPSDLVTIGQNLKVKIIQIDKQLRVSEYKALTETLMKTFQKISDRRNLWGTCTSLKDYGVFVKLEEGVEGLIHNSELLAKSKCSTK